MRENKINSHVSKRMKQKEKKLELARIYNASKNFYYGNEMNASSFINYTLI